MSNPERPEGETSREAIVRGILERMPDFIKEYGGTSAEIKPEQIHFIDAAAAQARWAEEETPEKTIEGGYDPIKKASTVLDSGNELENAHRVVHEVLHMNSFQALAPEKDGKVPASPKLKRLGLSISKKGTDEYYFDDFTEAVTAELARRFNRQHLESMPELAEEVENRRRLFEAASKGDATTIKFLEENYESIREVWDEESSEPKYDLDEYEGREEREKLQSLVAHLHKQNEDTFTPEEIFKLFSGAVFNGNILPLARLIRKTYGPKALRDIGEHTKRQHKA